MLQHLGYHFLESVPAFIVLPLALGTIVYFGLHYWGNVAALSRNRSQLLSVGTILAGVLGWQVYQTRTASTLDADLFSVSAAMPHAQMFTAESLAASGLPVVSTYHNDNFRTGHNTLETVLTPDNVNAALFGRLYSFPVDGYVYAQPLYMPQVAIPGNGIHNIVLVATQHDSVYAFDADSPAPAPLWRTSFVDPDAGITTIASSDVNASDIMPE